MERAIVGFHRDDLGDWVAELDCGHGRHVRHRPPWETRPWVISPEGRESRLGLRLECPKCEGDPAHVLTVVSTYPVAPGEGLVFDLVIPQPGKSTFVDHGIHNVLLGAAWILEVQ